MSSKATLLFLSCGEIKRSGRSHRVALSVPALNVARNWIRAPDYIVPLSRPRENRVITRIQQLVPDRATLMLTRCRILSAPGKISSHALLGNHQMPRTHSV